MARRFSAIFSLGSKHLDTNNNVSRPQSALNPGSCDVDPSPSAVLPSHRSTPDLRVVTSSSQMSIQHLQAATGLSPMDTSRLSPRFSPAISPPLPGLEEEEAPSPSLLPSPQFLQKPIPQQIESPGGSRPQSRAATPRSRRVSRDSSAPNSRAVSPAKFRASSPTGEQSKALKRRSWLPGSRAREESQSDEIIGSHSDESWIVTPQAQQRLYYDLIPLVNFRKVNASLLTTVI